MSAPDWSVRTPEVREALGIRGEMDLEWAIEARPGKRFEIGRPQVAILVARQDDDTQVTHPRHALMFAHTRSTFASVSWLAEGSQSPRCPTSSETG